MREYPSIPRAPEAPEELFEEGHLWLFEKVDGAQLRFQLQEAGFLRFGDRSRVYDPDDVPYQYQHAVRHVRNRLDRQALQAAVDDVESIVFFGEAMHHHSIDYDWARTPSFLGFDVWSADDGFRPLASIAEIFAGVGLSAVNTFAREVRTRDFDPESYTVPDSAWYDGPAEGVVVRNKRGGRAKLLHPEFRGTDEAAPIDGSVADLAAEFATPRRFETLAARLEDRETPVTVDRLHELAVEDIVREEHGRLSQSTDPVDMQAFRSEVAALTREFLDDRRNRD